ncbi:MAG: bifunctional sulfate adenylyltransferase/adenylylsulfate kinase, partial [Acidobacteria bacterium]|nr:bifunctional sulfate adenylyltransferase/adenylylsulfate kinase [Acidobacteriota bacterium]
DWPSWDLTDRQLCDLEMLATGGFSPLAGFMNREDYEAVCGSMRLKDGTIWPVPIALDVTENLAGALNEGTMLALRDPEGVMLAALEVESIWKPDRKAEAEMVYGTSDTAHPGVAHLLKRSHPWYAGGRVRVLQPPVHYDFRMLRQTPAEVRRDFARQGWRRIIGFQTRNPLHRVHVELTMRAVREAEANLLIHPVVGMTKPGDVDHYTRVRCYQAVMSYYPRHTAKLALLPLAMRLAGPREAIWHALIHKNYGCTHFILGRNHADAGPDGSGRLFYQPYRAQDLYRTHQEEIGVRMVAFTNMVYVEDLDDYRLEEEVPAGMRVLAVSGSDLRRRLTEGREIPKWFTYSEVARELRRTYPPRHRRGFTVFFTGLSGAGKSTIANVLRVRLLEMGGRPITLLDGDIVRKNLSSELGFSKEHRDINIRRIGFVASEITKNGGIALCAPIAPYESVREENRSVIEPCGGFILVHVSAPLEVCEQRDRKGLYAKARAGLIKEFTGISDPYEIPDKAELTIDTTQASPEEAAQQIILYLEKEGYIAPLTNGP